MCPKTLGSVIWVLIMEDLVYPVYLFQRGVQAFSFATKAKSGTVKS
jgi:hypothetical protein